MEEFQRNTMDGLDLAMTTWDIKQNHGMDDPYTNLCQYSGLICNCHVRNALST